VGLSKEASPEHLLVRKIDEECWSVHPLRDVTNWEENARKEVLRRIRVYLVYFGGDDRMLNLKNNQRSDSDVIPSSAGRGRP
jgi:hypothetical protein